MTSRAGPSLRQRRGHSALAAAQVDHGRGRLGVHAADQVDEGPGPFAGEPEVDGGVPAGLAVAGCARQHVTRRNLAVASPTRKGAPGSRRTRPVP